MAQTFTEILEILSEGRNLSSDEASFALGQIVAGEVNSEQVAAFLFGMRCKGESVEELTEFVRVMRGALIPVDVETEGAVDLCGTGGDLSGTFNISTAAMFVVAGAGIPVLKHGNRSVSSKSGSADVLEQMGVAVTLGKRGVEQLFEETSMAFMFAPNFHPAMKHVMPARRALAVRTFFNILGPLLNPARVQRQVVGAFNRKTAEMMVQILHNLDTRRAVTLHAQDGLDEISISSTTDLFHLDDSGIHPGSFEPESIGVQRADLRQLTGGDSQENARIIRAVFAGESTSAQRDVVLLNAAFGIYVSGRTDTLEGALELARESVRSGSAANALQRFAETSQRIAKEAKP